MSMFCRPSSLSHHSAVLPVLADSNQGTATRGRTVPNCGVQRSGESGGSLSDILDDHGEAVRLLVDLAGVDRRGLELDLGTKAVVEVHLGQVHVRIRDEHL